MLPGFSTSVKNSTTSALSFSISRKSPSIMPALGAIQTCSATRGPQSPRQRPSSHANSESWEPGTDCDGAGDGDGSDRAVEPVFDCAPAPADCCAKPAGEEVNDASAAPVANRKIAPILVRNKPRLPALQGRDFPTGFMLLLNRFGPMRSIFARNSITEVS